MKFHIDEYLISHTVASWRFSNHIIVVTAAALLINRTQQASPTANRNFSIPSPAESSYSPWNGSDLMQPANPFVYYHCGCPDFYQGTGRSTDAGNSRDSTTDPSSTDDRPPYVPFDTSSATDTDFSLFPLSRLYFCEDCHQIRCPSCVQDEVISYYCPNCLFEVHTLFLQHFAL